MSTTLSVATLVLAVLFILVEAGFGALRGMKKELCRVGSLLAIGLLLFFIVPGIAEGVILAIVDLIYPGGSSFSEIADMIAVDMNLNAATVGTMIETILALTASLLIPFVFVVLFWVCKLISWPIFALVCFIIHNARKPFPEKTTEVPETILIPSEDGAEQEVAASDEVSGTANRNSAENTATIAGVPVYKRKPDLTERLIGAAIGAVLGLFLGALTFMPLAQLSDSVDVVGKANVAELAGDEVADAAFFWSEAPAGGLYRVTQLEGLFGLLYDSLAKVEIEERIYEAESLEEILVLAPEVIEIMEALEDADVESFAEVAEPVKAAVKRVLEIELFSDKEKLELVQYLVDEALLKEAKSNELAAEALNFIHTMSYAEVKNDVLAAIDLIVVLDKFGLTDSASMGVIEKFFHNDSLIEEGTEAIYQLNLAEAVLPVAVDMALEEVLKNMDVTVVPCGKIDNFKETKDAFKQLLRLTGKLVDVAETIDELDSMEEVSEVLKEIEKLKDSPFVSKETYANLEKALIRNTIADGRAEETIQNAVKEHLEEVNLTTEENIDDEIIRLIQEAIRKYLAGETVSLEEINKIIALLQEGTLLADIADPAILDDIRSGNFDIAEWIQDERFSAILGQ